MAVVRMTLEEVQVSAQLDRAKVEATTEEDIRRHMIEDGEDPDAPLGPARVVLPPAEVRKRTGLSQGKFAERVKVPAGTIRNWEQGRTDPDPAARSLLDLIATDHDAMMGDLNPQELEALASLSADDLRFLQEVVIEHHPPRFPSHNEAARVREIERKLRTFRLDAVLKRQRG